MDFKYSKLVENDPNWDTEDLCQGRIDLRMHVAGDLEDIGIFRVAEDWRRLVGPLEAPYRGGMGPEYGFITITVPECLPERLEITSYALEFGFIHDDIIDRNIEDAELDDLEPALGQGGVTGEINEMGGSGKRKIMAQIMREMMAIDPERAMVVARYWSAGVAQSNRRKEKTDYRTLEEYIPYRFLDVGYVLWHSLVAFCCAITIPDEETDEARRLLEPTIISAFLTNDLFSCEKEKKDINAQNAVLVLMKEHNCSEEKAREICKEHIRAEIGKVVRNVEEVRARTDLSADTKRYIEIMQYTVSGNIAWSPKTPRYNPDGKFSDLQLLRAKYGIEKYPAIWPATDATGAPLVKPESKVLHINDNGQTNGHEERMNGSGTCEGTKMNGANGIKKPAHSSQTSTDSLALADVVSSALDWNLPELSDNVILQPYQYLTSLSSKGFREQTINSLNLWLKVPPKSINLIKKVVKALHSASLMLDDLEDGSPLRRGKTSTHNIYGRAQTINSATYQFTHATGLAAELSNPSCFRICIEEMQQLYVGQSYDLYWTYNVQCPSMWEYLKMVDKKTGGLFRILTRLMIAESQVHEKISDDDLNQLTCLLGRFFQIRDDYQNLASADYAQQKGFAEDLDEGKYSFTLIHCIQTLDSEPMFTSAAMQIRAFLMKRRFDGKLSYEAKREVLAIIKETKSLGYTLEVLRELHGGLEKEVESLESKFGEENFSLRLLLEMLKV